MATKWKDFCIAIDFDSDGTTLTIINTKHRGDPEDCCREVLMRWVQQKKPTWQNVIDCLIDARCGQLAETAKERALRLGENFVLKRICIYCTCVIYIVAITCCLLYLSITLPMFGYSETTEHSSLATTQDHCQDKPSACTPSLATTQDKPSTCTPSVAYSTSPKKEDITLKENTVSSKPKEDATLAKNITLSEPNPISFLPPSEGIRAYQRELAQPGLDGENYIICAPTGSGKTLIAAMIISEHLKKGQEIGEERKVLFLVKTQQLAHQQKDQLKRYVSKARIALVIGEEQLYIAPILPIVDLVVCTAGKICNELKSKDVSITDFSLLVVDECHHTHGTDPYSEILEFYLMAKLHGSITKVPQVVGLTALPGAGRGQSTSLSKAITHQLELCARLDASSGIKMVTENSEELSKHTNRPEHILTELECRSSSEQFIDLIIQAMMKLEEHIKGGPTFNQNSPQYKRWVDIEKEAAEMRNSPEERDRISVLQYLSQYCLTLTTYEDFTCNDAIEVLKKSSNHTPDHQATPTEQSLDANHENLLQQVSQLPPVSNPLLEGVERILHDQFTAKPNSKAIFFVREIRHTLYVRHWVENCPSLKSLIRPSTIVGCTKDGMTKEQQLEAIRGFKSEKYNLLVSTSVLEEGIDVAACNLVIRFQIMTNEIAEVQAQGRARAIESKMYTIMSSKSEKPEYLQLINEEKKQLALKAPFYVTELCRTAKFVEKQQAILAEKQTRERANALLKKLWNAEDVNVVCKKCKEIACKGSDIFTFQTHYVVPNDTFRQTKMIRRPHHKSSVHGSIHNLYKIYCKKCGEDWGVWSKWSNRCAEFPVVKCASFNFHHAENGLCTSKQWSKVPFDFLPLPISYYEEQTFD